MYIDVSDQQTRIYELIKPKCVPTPCPPCFQKFLFYWGNTLSPSLFPHLMCQGTHNIALKNLGFIL